MDRDVDTAMDCDADGQPPAERALLCSHGAGGGVTGEEEMPMGVPLIPDRAVARSRQTRWATEQVHAFGRTDRLIVASAMFSIVALAAAAIVGAVPLAAAGPVALLVPAAGVDFEQRRLPDVWVGAAALFLVVALAAGSAVGQPTETGSLVSGAIGGAIAMALPVLVLHLTSPNSMGFGDVKVAGVLGAAVGVVDWRLGVISLCFAALSGAAIGLGLRLRSIAFGPFLVFGAWCSLLGHDLIVNAIFAGGAAP